MDIKEQINQMVEKITKDPDIKAKFSADPVKTIESVLGVDLPDEVIEKIVVGVKGKLSAGALTGAVDSIKKLF